MSQFEQDRCSSGIKERKPRQPRYNHVLSLGASDGPKVLASHQWIVVATDL